MLDVPVVSSGGAEARAVAAPMADHATPAATDPGPVPVDGFLAALVAQSLTPWTPAHGEGPALTANPFNAAGQVLPGARTELAAPSPSRRTLAAPTNALLTAATPTALVDTPLAGPDTPSALDASAFEQTDDVAAGRAPPAVVAAVAASMEETLTTERGSSAAESRVSTPGSTALLHASVAHAPSRQADLAPSTQAYHGKPTLLPLAEPDLFTERLNQHVAIMLSEHSQFARIAVNPPELGPVEVRINVVGDEASIQIAAAHAATRDALQDALPRLRAALGDSGLALGDANVFAQMPHRESPPEHGGSRTAFEHDDDAEVARASTVRQVKLGLVDAFV